MDIPEENLSKQMMARFRREQGPKPSMSHITNILRIASNVRQAADIARPVPKEVLNQADQAVKHVQSALSMHENNAKLSEVLQHLKPGVDAITGVGHAIFKLGKEVHTKLENASEDFPGVYSDVMDTALGVPHEHLDSFVHEANKGN
jgi:hypothetical protein